MELQLVQKGLDFSRKKKKWLLLFAACGFSGYGMYRVYHLPIIAQKRKRVLKLLGNLFSLVEAISDSVETIDVVSKDLKDFLKSDSDKLPNSLKQISKIINSNEFSGSVVNVTQALTVGILNGYRLQARNNNDGVDTSSGFMDEVIDKLFSPAGSGFASVVVGSFARNLVMAFYSDEQSHSDSSTSSIPKWVNMVCSDDNCRELIGDCVQLFVSTAVGIYLDKTMNINTYDEFFAGLTNPKHETKVRDALLTVCNGAVETLVRTSHQVLTSSNSSSGVPRLGFDRGTMNATRSIVPRHKSLLTDDDVKHNGFIRRVSSTLAVPSNRVFVLDVTGRVTFEMVRSFLEILLEKINDGLRKSVNVAREAVVDTGLEIVRYVAAKSYTIATICLSLCLHIVDSPWIMIPA